jgi:[ribosomal protein S5]-alanine N-acetyltransferase
MAPRLPLPILTERLLLRDFRAEDEAAIHAYASDPEVTRHMFFPPRTEAETHEYLSRILGTQRERPRLTWELAVVQRGQDRPIGACDLTLESGQDADLGYILAREAWGQGLATELATALAQAGFEHLGLERIFAICEVSHTASARVLMKAGLRRAGTLERYREAKGRWWDMDLYELQRDAWLAGHTLPALITDEPAEADHDTH